MRIIRAEHYGDQHCYTASDPTGRDYPDFNSTFRHHLRLTGDHDDCMDAAREHFSKLLRVSKAEITFVTPL